MNESTRAALPPWDLGAALFVEGLCEGRFYPIFSVLFGFGTGVLLDRGLAVYGRRIGALLMLGLLHATFGWYGDVLLNYAAAGLVLILLARLETRSLFAIVVALLAATEIASLRFDDWLWGSSSGDSAAYLDAAVRTYRDGTFASITRERIDDLLGYFTLLWNISYRVNVLAMATLGLALERAKVQEKLHALRRPIGSLALVLTVVGLALAGSLAFVPQLYLAAGDVLAFGYALSFLFVGLGARRGSFPSRASDGWRSPVICSRPPVSRSSSMGMASGCTDGSDRPRASRWRSASPWAGRPSRRCGSRASSTGRWSGSGVRSHIFGARLSNDDRRPGPRRTNPRNELAPGQDDVRAPGFPRPARPIRGPGSHGRGVPMIRVNVR